MEILTGLNGPGWAGLLVPAKRENLTHSPRSLFLWNQLDLLFTRFSGFQSQKIHNLYGFTIVILVFVG
ncbi:hypothetical protein Nepgr_001360 [Nepenthes gracilis]|uniref:Uncharacterized protein n=1 Tax=Nepenthes gracilis TaxID=150966 RepID=A0AAD3P4P4_NEPGR|nr:hypothetical protein Nepgr_001360 [Nepenthes gracilis]